MTTTTQTNTAIDNTVATLATGSANVLVTHEGGGAVSIVVAASAPGAFTGGHTIDDDRRAISLTDLTETDNVYARCTRSGDVASIAVTKS